MTDQKREEAEEVAAWAVSEANRLRVEVERLRRVHEAARSLVSGAVDDRNDVDGHVRSLREALYDSECAEWLAARPKAGLASLLDAPAWLCRRPLNGHDVGARRMRSWMEGSGETEHACVTDGNAILSVVGARVVENGRPPPRKGLVVAGVTVDMTPWEATTRDVDWANMPWVLQYDDFMPLVAYAMTETGDDRDGGTCRADLVFGETHVDPLLVHHFMPRWLDSGFFVSKSADPLDPIGFRACGHGLPRWRLAIMPRRSSPEDRVVRVELQAAP